MTRNPQQARLSPSCWKPYPPPPSDKMELLWALVLLAVLVIGQRILYERRAFRKLEYKCEFSVREAVQGDEIGLVETITNRKALPLPWLRAELVTSRWLEYAQSQSLVTDETRFVTSFFSLHGWQKTTRSWKVKCLRRGVFPVEKCVLLATDLAGTMSTASPVKTDARLVVLPRPMELEEALCSARTLSGDVVVRRHYLEDPFYTAGVREYTPRDSMGKIHWPATARQGRLMVHNDLCTADQNLLVILNVQTRRSDIDETTDLPRLEDCISICAGYLEDTLRSGIPVRLAVNTGRESAVLTEEFAGREHVLDLMRILAAIDRTISEQIDSFLENTVQNLDASDIVVISSFLSRGMYAFARSRQETGSRVKLVSAVSVDASDLPDDCEVIVMRRAAEI